MKATVHSEESGYARNCVYFCLDHILMKTVTRLFGDISILDLKLFHFVGLFCVLVCAQLHPWRQTTRCPKNFHLLTQKKKVKLSPDGAQYSLKDNIVPGREPLC